MPPPHPEAQLKMESVGYIVSSEAKSFWTDWAKYHTCVWHCHRVVKVCFNFLMVLRCIEGMGCSPSDKQGEHGGRRVLGRGAFALGLEEYKGSDGWLGVCEASMPGQAARGAHSVSSTYSGNKSRVSLWIRMLTGKCCGPWGGKESGATARLNSNREVIEFR